MILAINTATEKVSIAIYKKNKVEKEVLWRSYHTQSREILPEINKLLKKNKIKLKNLVAISVCLGPGSYTGLRVGTAIANCLGWALDKPVIGVLSNKRLALNIAKIAFTKLNNKKVNRFCHIVSPQY